MKKKKKFRWLWILLGLAILLGVLWISTPGEASFKQAITWQKMVSPGGLSKAHAFLENNCAACHTAVKGVEPTNCILCHANNEALLKRQPTSFHAHVASCKECHLEHRGKKTPPTIMDHSALVRIGMRTMQQDSRDRVALLNLKHWIKMNGNKVGDQKIKPEEKLLNCYVCHRNDDRHFGLFGKDCVQCHSVKKWNIPKFRHPSPSSRDCSQCHQAPPSHYMMHFGMISQKVAGKHKAKVRECYACHQTTSWPDIKRVGWYKHH